MKIDTLMEKQQTRGRMAFEFSLLEAELQMVQKQLQETMEKRARDRDEVLANMETIDARNRLIQAQNEEERIRLDAEIAEIKRSVEEKDAQSARDKEELRSRVQRSEDETRRLRRKTEEEREELKEIIRAMEEKLTIIENEETVNSLERRLASLEAAVTKAIDSSFPRVEALLSQINLQPESAPYSGAKANPSSPSPSPTTAAGGEGGPSAERDEQLIKAALLGRADAVRHLAAEGANVHFTDSHGWSALHWAAAGNHRDAAEALLQCGADVDARDAFGVSALHCAAWNGHASAVALLLRLGADVHGADDNRMTPLHNASASGDERCVRLLVEAGARPLAENKWGMTPRDYSHADAIRALLRHPA